MDAAMILQLLARYGALILLVITFLEALNLPGLPAGVILPAAGAYASSGGISFFKAVLFTIIGGILGGLVLYLIGRIGGTPVLDFFRRRNEKLRNVLERCERFLKKGGFTAVFIGRILPVVRTILPLPAGAFRVSVKRFVAASVLGISCYNLVCVGAGYFLGNVLL